jgi:exo-beta-1,3-glucanase (GH17 family)
MNSNLFASATRTIKVVKATVASALLLVIISCGGGGGTTPVTDLTTTNGGLRALSADFISRKAVNYSPYRTATKVGHPYLTNLDGSFQLDANGNKQLDPADTSNENITDAMVLEDLTLIHTAGFGLIRLFNSNLKVAERTIRLLRDNPTLDIKVYLGMWMAGYDEPGNQNEIAFGVALAKSYPDIVVAVSVGNESLVNWSDHAMQPAVMASHLAYVRSQITQPVTTDDNWAYYAAADRIILDNIDFASVHTYAMVDTHYNPTFWDWKQLGQGVLTQRATDMMNAALVATKKDYDAARRFIDSKGLLAMPIVIGETGWMAVNPSNGWYKFLAHPVNQKMYVERLAAWANEGKTGAGPKNVFYFEAFDELWKGDDNGWGLFNKDRQARYALHTTPISNPSLGNGATWVLEPVAALCTRPSGAQYTDSEALYYDYAVASTAVSASKYTVFADTLTSGEARPTACDMWWDAYGGDSAGYLTTSSVALPGDSPNGLKITPVPKDYGWGLLYHSRSDVTDNLSAYEATGHLNFSIKTDYVGSLKVGINTDTYDRSGAEAYVILSSSSLHTACDAVSGWCNVSIPLTSFKTVNPNIDFKYVTTRFAIADVYNDTGNTPLQTKVINLDAIFWSK